MYSKQPWLHVHRAKFYSYRLFKAGTLITFGTVSLHYSLRRYILHTNYGLIMELTFARLCLDQLIVVTVNKLHNTILLIFKVSIGFFFSESLYRLIISAHRFIDSALILRVLLCILYIGVALKQVVLKCSFGVNALKKKFFPPFFVSGKVRSLSSALWSLTHLTALHLSDNSLSRIPPDIAKLHNLVYLDLSSNKIRSLPAELGSMVSLR